MATDRDEQQRQPQDEQLRQQQELEEIRRSFAEMGARMGSLFEPAEDDDEDEQPILAQRPAPAALPAPRPAPAGDPSRPRWWAAAVLALVFVAGGLIGFIVPRGDSAGPTPAPEPPVVTATTAPAPEPSVTQRAETRTSVPEVCIETAELADEVIARLNRNLRDDRLATALKGYTLASQACREEAQP
jgi:hypothetical protein